MSLLKKIKQIEIFAFQMCKLRVTSYRGSGAGRVRRTCRQKEGKLCEEGNLLGYGRFGGHADPRAGCYGAGADHDDGRDDDDGDYPAAPQERWSGRR